jgi:hypothetical protein
MKPLAEVLASIETTVKQRANSTQTSSAGSGTMDSSVPTPCQPEQQSLAVQTVEQSSSNKPRTHLKTRLAASVLLNDEEKKELLKFVRVCFETLDTYGKTPQQLGTASEVFVRMLSKYDMELVREGFYSYMERNSRMPTPSDIINIIDPPPWKPDWAYYHSLKESIKRGNQLSPYSAEHRYMKKCEEYALQEMRDDEERMS